MANAWSKFATYISFHGGLFLGPMKETDTYPKMFQRLISEEEAKLGMFVPNVPTSVQDIAEAAKMPQEKIAPMLKHMSQKGVIFERLAGDRPFYNITPFIPGFYEYVMTDPETKKDPVMAEMFRDIASTGMIMQFVPGQDGGLLKVTPVMKEMDAQRQVYSFEDLLTFVNKANKYSVADCACRLSAKLVDKGCIHPVEDTCVQFDDTADYYIRTGRGREVSREECIEILKKTEDAGLVHTAFSVEGEDYSSFICNCCGCSCSGLRFLNVFDGNPFSKSNFRAQITEENCVACGSCVEICPVNAITLGTSFCEKEDQTYYYKKAAENWMTKDDIHMDFINERHMVSTKGTAPCKTACPAHISVQGYIRKAAEGKYLEALEVIKRDNPLPAVCGRICSHPCEAACTRGDVDEPLAIDAIKMFVADQERHVETRYVPEKKHDYNQKVAIIGSGPAGLTCAYYLAEQGYKVTVFEKNERLGGMLTLGIPNFRLEKEVIESEIQVLRDLDVEFKTGVNVGTDITIPELRNQGYEAFYVAIGAQQGSSLGLEGEELEGVVSGVDFLREVNLGKNEEIKGRAVVIGGGNVAIDVARTAIREGATSVDLYCLESEANMPADPEERYEAMQEGVVIHNGWGPMVITGKDGKATGVTFKKCVSVFDANGNFAPAYDESATLDAEASAVLMAVGQRIELGELLVRENIDLGRGNRIVVDTVSFQTGEEDIFAGGDVVTGPKFAIDAIAMGKQGAESIHRLLQHIHLTDGRHGEYFMIEKQGIHVGSYDHTPRQHAEEVDYSQAARTFEDLRRGLSEEQIAKETSRCLNCGRSIVDTDKCIGCGVCTKQCEFDAIHLTRVSDSTPAVNFGTWYKRLAKYTAKRTAKIAINSIRSR